MTTSVSTISLKLPTIIKAQLAKTAKTQRQTVSQYLRSIIMDKLNLSVKQKSPFLDIAGTMTEAESVVMLAQIQTNRQNRKSDYWHNLIN